MLLIPICYYSHPPKSLKTLDFDLSSVPSLVSDVRVIPGISGHPHKVYDYDKADFDKPDFDFMIGPTPKISMDKLMSVCWVSRRLSTKSPILNYYTS